MSAEIFEFPQNRDALDVEIQSISEGGPLAKICSPDQMERLAWALAAPEALFSFSKQKTSDELRRLAAHLCAIADEFDSGKKPWSAA